MSETPLIRVIFTPDVEADLKWLRKRYRHIDLDVEPIVELLEQGELPGDKIPGVGYDAYKVRVKNRDAQKGKKGGYRIIYYVRMSDLVYLLTIYSKSDQSDVTLEEVRRIIETILDSSNNPQQEP